VDDELDVEEVCDAASFEKTEDEEEEAEEASECS